jgi:hypothetical protein
MDPYEGQPVFKVLEENMSPRRFELRMGQDPGTPPLVQGQFPLGGELSKQLHMTGPVNTFIFDIMDRAFRFGLYKQFKDAGLPGTMAAEFSNRHMIDYSLRFLSPDMRRLGHGLFTFFPWMVGNLMLHVPNMMENPRMYALEAAIRNWVNSNYNSYGNDPRRLSSALTYAYATPAWSYRGHQWWVLPELPAYAYERLLKRIADHPITAPENLLNFFLYRTRFGSTYATAKNLGAMKRKEEASLPEWLFGIPAGAAGAPVPGAISETLWGLPPIRKGWETAHEALHDPRAWSDEFWVLLNLMIRAEEAQMRQGTLKLVKE